MSKQAVRFKVSDFPFQRGDETVLEAPLADTLREKNVVEFVANREPEPASPPPPPAPNASGEDLPVEIPENWESLHHQQIMKLARSINGVTYTNAADAKGAIKDELARRAASPE